MTNEGLSGDVILDRLLLANKRLLLNAGSLSYKAVLVLECRGGWRLEASENNNRVDYNMLECV